MRTLIGRFYDVARPLLAMTILGLSPVVATAQEVDETTRSALFLVENSTRTDPDGRHSEAITALRKLHDPALAPLFDWLARSQNPSQKIHGLLGLAECSQEQELDLVRMAAIDNPAMQAEILSAAMDNDLLPPHQAQQLVNWPDMDSAVKTLVAARLVRDRQFSDVDLLLDAAQSENLARKGLAGLLLMQLERPEGLEVLLALDEHKDTQHDDVRLMLLETAVRYQFHRVAPWATKVCTEPGVDSRVGLLALKASIRFGAPRGANIWKNRFATTSDPADRTRLALLALGLAPYVDRGFFKPLEADTDPLIHQIGQAGRAIASNHQVDIEVIRLIELHHPMVNRWALSYAERDAQAGDAQVILLGMIMAYDDAQKVNPREASASVISATRKLCTHHPTAAASYLRPILADPRTDPGLTQGILQGLLRCRASEAEPVIAGLTPPSEMATHNLWIVLLARCTLPMTQTQTDVLKLLVRGGGGLDVTLRLQAAWSYLKRTGQTNAALTRVLDG